MTTTDHTDEINDLSYLDGETDAQVWARAFLARFDVSPRGDSRKALNAEDIVIGWFANAIGAGITKGWRRAEAEREAEQRSGRPLTDSEQGAGVIGDETGGQQP